MRKKRSYVKIPKPDQIETNLSTEEVDKVIWHLRNRKYNRLNKTGMGYLMGFRNGTKSVNNYIIRLPDKTQYSLYRTVIKKEDLKPKVTVKIVPYTTPGEFSEYPKLPTELYPPDFRNLPYLPE